MYALNLPPTHQTLHRDRTSITSSAQDDIYESNIRQYSIHHIRSKSCVICMSIHCSIATLGYIYAICRTPPWSCVKRGWGGTWVCTCMLGTYRLYIKRRTTTAHLWHSVHMQMCMKAMFDILQYTSHSMNIMRNMLVYSVQSLHLMTYYIYIYIYIYYMRVCVRVCMYVNMCVCNRKWSHGLALHPIAYKWWNSFVVGEFAMT